MKAPAGWAIASLGELCFRIVDGSHNPPQAVAEGVYMLSARNISNRRINFEEYRFISNSDFAVENERTKIQAGNVLLTIVGAIGRIAVVPDGIKPFALQRSVAVLKPNGAALPKYLAYAIEAPEIQQFLRDNAKGTAQKGIYLKALGRLQLPLAPFPEQQRLANKLDSIVESIDTCRARLDRVPQILKKFREAVLEAAVSGRLTENWRQHSASASAEWVSSTFEDITESSLYGPRFSSADYIEDGVPTLRTTDMDSYGRIVPKSPPKVRISTANMERLGLRDGDLVMTRTGATIGKCAVYDASLGPALPSAYLIRFRLRQERVVPRFALLFILSPFGQRLLFTGSTSFAQPNINAKTIRQFSITLPGLTEQSEIVRRVDALLGVGDTLERRFEATVERIVKIVPSVLAKAFRGELVPQDPKDEPAGEMLDRIEVAKNVSRNTKESAGTQK